MSHTVIFYCLATFAAYTIGNAWRREAQANALATPLVLTIAQALIVLISTYLADVLGHPGGPSVDVLIAVYWKGLLPLSLVQIFLLRRRRPDFMGAAGPG